MVWRADLSTFFELQATTILVGALIFLPLSGTIGNAILSLYNVVAGVCALFGLYKRNLVVLYVYAGLLGLQACASIYLAFEFSLMVFNMLLSLTLCAATFFIVKEMREGKSFQLSGKLPVWKLFVYMVPVFISQMTASLPILMSVFALAVGLASDRYVIQQMGRRKAWLLFAIPITVLAGILGAVGWQLVKDNAMTAGKIMFYAGIFCGSIGIAMTSVAGRALICDILPTNEQYVGHAVYVIAAMNGMFFYGALARGVQSSPLWLVPIVLLLGAGAMYVTYRFVDEEGNSEEDSESDADLNKQDNAVYTLPYVGPITRPVMTLLLCTILSSVGLAIFIGDIYDYWKQVEDYQSPWAMAMVIFVSVYFITFSLFLPNLVAMFGSRKVYVVANAISAFGLLILMSLVVKSSLFWSTLFELMVISGPAGYYVIIYGLIRAHVPWKDNGIYVALFEVIAFFFSFLGWLMYRFFHNFGVEYLVGIFVFAAAALVGTKIETGEPGSAPLLAGHLHTSLAPTSDAPRASIAPTAPQLGSGSVVDVSITEHE